MSAAPTEHPADRVRRGLYLGALGVVFGDIGTSPYTIQTVFNPDDAHPVAASLGNVYGIISLIFWSVVAIVTLTYVVLVMRMDNDGEGGIMALITLVGRQALRGSRRTKAVLAALGIFGASLFFGDSTITPAISVLSAVEGLKVAAPTLEHLVLPITTVVIVALFLFQRAGSEAVGRLFGPIMVVWFLAIGAFGAVGIVDHPEILKALSPTYAIEFMAGHFVIAFFALAAVVLSVTGAEALYADMAHFGRRPITLAWLTLVFPTCILSYLGQGAYIIGHPTSGIASPFFLLVPEWARLPMVLLATAATVIASQAVITGAFSVAHQAVQLGYLPRLRILHTSESTAGQIYVPLINWILLASVLVLVFSFRTSIALAYAFGMAVTGTITITTVLFLFLARRQWGAPLWAVGPVGAVLLTIDGMFLAANFTKLTSGAWLLLLIGVAVFVVLMTWHRGRAIVTRQRLLYEGPLRTFVDELHERTRPLLRVPGTAVFLNRGVETTPLAMRASVDHLGVLHEHVVILSIVTTSSPRADPTDHLTIDDLGYTDDGIFHVNARLGYMDQADVPAILRQIGPDEIECPLEVDDATFFLSTIELRRSNVPGMARWRRALFLATATMTTDAADSFNLPKERTIVVGSHVDVGRAGR